MMNSITSKLNILFVIVISNYLAQIPYNIHLYGGKYNPSGVLLLLFTLIWFLIGFILLRKKVMIGYWIFLSYLFTVFLFYFNSLIIMMFFGYGLIYHLMRFNDMILWWVFLIGDINFFAAGFYNYYLLKRKTLYI